MNRRGRMGEALITDSEGSLLHYKYTVGGVTYNATQDVSPLRERLPSDLTSLIGHATMKYAPSNPANSIVICEYWSGLRRNQRAESGNDSQRRVPGT